MNLNDLYELVPVIGRALSGVPVGWLAAGVIALPLLFLLVRRLRRLSAEQLSDASVFVVGAAGLSVAAYGTVRALVGLHQPWPMAVASSVAIEGGALALIFDLYRKVKAREDAMRPRVASWTFALFSAVANISHPPSESTSPAGLAIFAAVPFLSLYLIEYRAAAHRVRTAAVLDRGLAGRVLGAAWQRWWTGLATWLGLDARAETTDVEQELRVRRAAAATYALRRAVEASQVPDKGRLAAHRARRRARRVRDAMRTAQAARLRAGVATDPAAALQHAVLVRELVHGPDDAAADWRDVAAAATRTLGRPVRLPGAGPKLAEGEPMRVPSARTDGPVVRALSGPRTGTPVRLSGTDKSSRSGAEAPRRTADVSDLVPQAEQFLSEIVARGEKPNRARMAAAFRDAEMTLSSDRAYALWALVKDRVDSAAS